MFTLFTWGPACTLVGLTIHRARTKKPLPIHMSILIIRFVVGAIGKINKTTYMSGDYDKIFIIKSSNKV